MAPFAGRARSTSTLLAALAFTGEVRAEEPAASDAANSDAGRAERLFAEGRDLDARGEHAAACARFEESHRIKPTATGPLVNIALCKERQGRYATAADMYRLVRTRAVGVQPERAEFAERRIRELEARSSHLKVIVPERSRDPGLVVKVDGRALPPSGWNVDIPLDGGDHVIEATAPGHREFRGTTSLGVERDRAVVEIDFPSDGSGRRTAAFIVGGAGALALAVGVGFGISAAVECGGFFQDVCEGANNFPTLEERQRALESAELKGWIANIGVGVGVVGLAVGSYLLLTVPKTNRVGLSLSPVANGGRVSIDARF